MASVLVWVLWLVVQAVVPGLVVPGASGTVRPGMYRVTVYTGTVVFFSTPWALISGKLTVPVSDTAVTATSGVYMVVHGEVGHGVVVPGVVGGGSGAYPGGTPWYGSGGVFTGCFPL